MTAHRSKVNADVDRVSKLMCDFAERCYELAEERGEENFRFETLGIVAVVAFEESEETHESTAAAFESKRHHVQTGILVDVLESHKND